MFCGRKNNDSVKRFEGLVRGMLHGNNMVACVRQNVTGVSVAEITFEVGYIFSPKCPLSKAKRMLDTYTRPRGRCFLVSIKKFKTCIFRQKILAITICHLATKNFYLLAS